jgi:hypothetical protein
VFSSRKIERATYDSVAFRFIAANDYPDHDTIATFRRRFLADIERLFVEVLALTHQAEPVTSFRCIRNGPSLIKSSSRTKGKLNLQLAADQSAMYVGQSGRLWPIWFGSLGDVIALLERLDHLYGPTPGEPCKPARIVLDNGSAHRSKATLAALAARSHWLTPEWLAKYATELSDIERSLKHLKGQRLASSPAGC